MDLHVTLETYLCFTSFSILNTKFFDVLNHQKMFGYFNAKIVSGWRQQYQQMEGKKDREMRSGMSYLSCPRPRQSVLNLELHIDEEPGPGASFPVYIPDSSQGKHQRLLSVLCLSSLSHKVRQRKVILDVILLS